MYDYINEAFKRLDLLSEDVFEPTAQGIKDLSDFLDGDDVDTIVDVIDPEANTEEELSDSYVGKVIVNCNVCHSHVFEDKGNIVIDEDGSVNVDKQCPYCGESSGFAVIGEIKPFTTETEVDDDTSADTDVSTDTDIDVDLATTTEGEDQVDKEPVTEAWGSDSISSLYQEILDFLKSKGYTCVSPACKNYIWSVVDYVTMARDETPDYSVEQWFNDTKQNYPEDFELFECSLTEDFEKATIESTDDVTTVDVGEDGEVSINVAPKTAEGNVEVTDGDATVADEEMISPLSDETQAEIEAENGMAPADDADGATESDSEGNDGTEPVADDTTDVDIEEVDEESMDELGESYMKRVYDNVSSFKTTSISGTDTKLVVEGVITFTSGATKNTGFIFEASKATPSGKVTFVGLNEHFSKSKRAFLLAGTVSEKKLVFESLNYKYSVEDKLVSGKVSRK